MAPMENAKTMQQNPAIVHDIVQAVSEEENCDELDIPPLYGSIDPDALGSLAAECEIQFEFAGYEVAIENGTVTVD